MELPSYINKKGVTRGLDPRVHDPCSTKNSYVRPACAAGLDGYPGHAASRRPGHDSGVCCVGAHEGVGYSSGLRLGEISFSPFKLASFELRGACPVTRLNTREKAAALW